MAIVMDTAAIISHAATDEMLDSLRSRGIKPIRIPPCPHVAPELAGHPDIQVFVFRKKVYCHRDISRKFLRDIEPHAEIEVTSTVLGRDYPRDIPFNAACTGTHAFHLFERCDSTIRNTLEDAGIILLDVKQGYTKCSTLIVAHGMIVTSDQSIHKKAIGAGVISLLIRTGHVDLPGYAYGFIGGASGATGDVVYFTGNIRNHPDADRIIQFIESSGKRISLLSEGPLVDLGSILFL